jgi:Tat protein translocase TatB subunit
LPVKSVLEVARIFWRFNLKSFWEKNMFGIGMPELILIAVIALIVIGPEKLPGLARTLGKIFGELKKATNEFKETMEVETKMADVKKAFNGINEEALVDKASAVNEPANDNTKSFDTKRDDKNDDKESGQHASKGTV